jgi:hypothetical protein
VFATLLPASVNGIGLREATAVALYTRVGVPGSVAVLIPTVGFLMELALSSSGGLVFLTRRVGYQVAISVEDPGREDRIQAQVPAVPVARQPRVRRGLALGISAGIVAGSIVGASEGLWIVHDSFGKPALSLLVYAVGSYSIAFAIVGGALGSMSALSGRWLAREAFAESTAFAHGTALLSVIGALAIATFRLERVHVYAPPAWSSGRALLVVLAAIAGYFAIARGLGAFSSRKIGAWLLRPWGAPLMAAGVVLPLTAAAALALRRAAPPIARPAPPSDAPDVLLIVVEEPLPSSGERSGETPYLERFAADAVRFESTFAAGATARSNLAAILSGRDPRRRASTSEKIVTLP